MEAKLSWWWIGPWGLISIPVGASLFLEPAKLLVNTKNLLLLIVFLGLGGVSPQQVRDWHHEIDGVSFWYPPSASQGSWFLFNSFRHFLSHTESSFVVLLSSEGPCWM